MGIKITENGVVRYENEPNVDRLLFPNNPDCGHCSEQIDELKENLDENVSELKNDLIDITGNAQIEFTSGGYIRISDATADINSIVPNAQWRHAVVACVEGDSFTVSGVGGSAPRMWGFVSSNGTVLSVANASSVETQRAITAPENSAYLVLNDNSNAVSYYGILVKNQLSNLADGMEWNNARDGVSNTEFYTAQNSQASISSQRSFYPYNASANTSLRINVSGDIFNNTVYLYLHHNSQTGTLYGAIVSGRDYTIPLDTDLTGVSIYCASADVGEYYYKIQTLNYIISPVERIEQIDALIDVNHLSADDLEEGRLIDNTGDESPATSRARTRNYISVSAGTVIKSTIPINVFEYTLVEHEYITDYNNWTNSYTVSTDCAVRIVWRNNDTLPFVDLVNATEFVWRDIKNVALDESFIADIAKNSVAAEYASKTVKTIAHRGDPLIAPQCTAPSYIAARQNGFTIMENDLNLSEDGQFVMWHDNTLARLGDLVDIEGYAVYTDGTSYYYVNSDNQVYTYDDGYVASSTPLTSLTRCSGASYGVNSNYGAIGLPLSVLKRIDFGIYKGSKFAGTQILTFEEWVMLCKKLGVKIYIDKKITYTSELLTAAASVVKSCGMSEFTSWLSVGGTAMIDVLRAIIPGARCGLFVHPTQQIIDTYLPYNIGKGVFFDGDAKNGLTAESVRLGLMAGFDVEVYYVDYTDTASEIYNTIKTAIDTGITGITLDHYRLDQVYSDLFY